MPKRVFSIHFVDDGETVQMTLLQEDRIGSTLVGIYGQSKDFLSLPVGDVDQWRRDMAVAALEAL